MTLLVTDLAPLAAWGAELRDRKGWDRWHSRPLWLEAERWAVDHGLGHEDVTVVTRQLEREWTRS